MTQDTHERHANVTRRASEFISQLVKEGTIPRSMNATACDIAIDLSLVTKEHLDAAVAEVQKRHAKASG